MKALDSYDADGNGQISSKELPIGDKFYLSFSILDEDRDGIISIKELQKPKFLVTFFLYDKNLDGAATINKLDIPDHKVTFILDGEDTITEALLMSMWVLRLDYSAAETQDLVDHVETAGKEARYLIAVRI